ncbi:hypothetical protein Mapa_017818 [Marchantia paleacea]|nr:hypothetical protein Mapa_017818 [Marchantia paleacea]
MPRLLIVHTNAPPALPPLLFLPSLALALPCPALPVPFPSPFVKFRLLLLLFFRVSRTKKTLLTDVKLSLHPITLPLPLPHRASSHRSVRRPPSPRRAMPAGERPAVGLRHRPRLEGRVGDNDHRVRTTRRRRRRRLTEVLVVAPVRCGSSRGQMS